MKNKDLVCFVRVEDGDIWAFLLPNEKNDVTNPDDFILSYASCGQHAEAHQSWLREAIDGDSSTSEATEEQYTYLFDELKEQVGYDLEIISVAEMLKILKKQKGENEKL